MSHETKLVCPINRAVAALADKWKILIILTLQTGTVRFGELLKHLEGIAPKVLTRQLRSLEHDGLVVRTVFAEVPPRVEYALTRSGLSLLPILPSAPILGNGKRRRTLAGNHRPRRTRGSGLAVAVLEGKRVRR